jgi:predicted Zn-dependent protease
MLLLQACMRTNLFIMILSVPISVGLPLSESFTAPTPLERATELARSNQPEEALEVLSIYHHSREEFSGYHDVYAQALERLNKRFDSVEHYCLACLYAGSEAGKGKLLLERAEVYSAPVPF